MLLNEQIELVGFETGFGKKKKEKRKKKRKEKKRKRNL